MKKSGGELKAIFRIDMSVELTRSPSSDDVDTEEHSNTEHF